MGLCSCGGQGSEGSKEIVKLRIGKSWCFTSRGRADGGGNGVGGLVGGYGDRTNGKGGVPPSALPRLVKHIIPGFTWYGWRATPANRLWAVRQSTTVSTAKAAVLMLFDDNALRKYFASLSRSPHNPLQLRNTDLHEIDIRPTTKTIHFCLQPRYEPCERYHVTACSTCKIWHEDMALSCWNFALTFLSEIVLPKMLWKPQTDLDLPPA
ncbi:hypothetical protein L208DRAFT_1381871 [Tricholoma matsutake]|nr:hypothetical protein L208DRAFT_1381871 [Tricholoma matsutake 945]